MAKLENFTSPLPNRDKLEAELENIERLILLNEADENTIERTKKQEELQELQDFLLDEIKRL